MTALAQRAAVLSLENEPELQVRIDELIEERTKLVAALREAGVELEDSHANFIWLNTGERTAAVDASLRAAGIWARAFAGEGIRISIGSAAGQRADCTRRHRRIAGVPRACLTAPPRVPATTSPPGRSP